MIKNNRKVKISCIFGLLVLSSIFFPNFTFIDRSTTRIVNPTTSAIWSTNFIHVQNNWSSFTEISGNGSWHTPYLIENVIMDASTSPTDSGILIEDEKTSYFKIKNCTITNWGSTFEDGGIKLLNSSNGWIENNTCSGSSYSGIVLMGNVAGTKSSNNNTVYDNTISNNANRGVYIQTYSANNTIIENRINNNNYGVDLWQYCEENTIRDNEITGNNRGINLQTESNINTIEFNELEDNGFGIHINEECHDNTLFNNTITESTGDAIFINGGFNQLCLRNTIKDNYISTSVSNGIDLIYANDHTISNNIVIDNGAYGLELKDSASNTVENNLIISNGNSAVDGGILAWTNSNNNDFINNTLEDNWDYGLYFILSSGNVIYNNTIRNHDYGIRVYSSCASTQIINNTISNCLGPTLPYGINVEVDCTNTLIEYNSINNTETGIYIDSNTDSTDVNGNTFSNCNSAGIFVQTSDCDNGEVWNNTFIDNAGVNARDDSGPTDTNWSKSGRGNYWDDYGGIDCDGDGIGDTPYAISGSAGSQDDYPLHTQPLPIITENNIDEGDLFVTTPPEFNLDITVYALDSTWYQLTDGSFTSANTTFTYVQGVNTPISQAIWDQMGNGTITITFYASDPCGNEGELSVNVRRDIIGPEISVTNPLNSSVKAFDDRSFEYSVDSTADSVWYSIEGGQIHYITGNGEFNQAEWDAAWNATAFGEFFVITFYTNDTLGNIASVEISISPDKPDPNAPAIPFGNCFLIVGLIATISLVFVVRLKLSKK